MTSLKNAATFLDTQRIAQKAMKAIVDEKAHKATFALLLAGAWTAHVLGWERSRVVRIVGLLYDASSSTQREQNRTDPNIN